MKGSAKNQWQYQSAFIIQFRPETDFQTGRCTGRVEHAASHEAARFNTLDELLAFLNRTLKEAQARQSNNQSQ
ncbi:MAG: hypothetical protein ABI977_18470 [Acidobacteriota bacterium]